MTNFYNHRVTLPRNNFVSFASTKEFVKCFFQYRLRRKCKSFLFELLNGNKLAWDE